MKLPTKSILSLAVALALGCSALSAQSSAASNQFGQGSQHAVTASGQAGAAVGHSVVGSAHVVSVAVAVPVWIGGAVIASGGELLSKTGTAAMKAGDQWWDCANGDPTKRPALDREKCLPPTPQPPPQARVKDPAPEEALQAKL